MPTRSIDTATIAFGLVSIPVKIYSTNEPSHEIHFNFVHAGCGERLHQQYVCPEHGAVSRDEMVKGFELTKGNYVELSKQELKALEAVASDEIALTEFVPAAAVDPLFVAASYYLGPDKAAERAYRLFRDALERSALVGIARYAARGKQYIVEVRPYADGLVMHQLRYPDEVKAWSEVPLPKLPAPAPAELGLAQRVIDGLRHDTFDPTQYDDEVKDRVRKLIAKKAKGGEISVPEAAPKPVVTDLMAALKASLEGTKPGKAHVATIAEEAPAGRTHGKAARAATRGKPHATTTTGDRASHRKRAARTVRPHGTAAHRARSTRRSHA